MGNSEQDARIRKQVRQLISHSLGERLREQPARPADLAEKSTIPRLSLGERMRRLIARQKKLLVPSLRKRNNSGTTAFLLKAVKGKPMRRILMIGATIVCLAS